MSDDARSLIRDGLRELQGLGVGAHLHLDDILGESAPPRGAPEWRDVAMFAAQTALDFQDQFVVVVPLEPWARVPDRVDDVSVFAMSTTEPPSMRLAGAASAPIPQEGEFYRLNFPGRAAGIRVAVSAWRTPDDIDAGDPLHASLIFET